MKNILKTVALLLFTGSLLNGCSNDLDEKVYSKVTEDTYNYTTEDFHPTVASVYSYLRFIGHDNYWATQEFTGDIIVNPPNSSGWDDAGTYRMLHYHKWTSEQNHVKVMWEKFYQGVILCNTVIEQIESGTLPAPSEEEKTKGLAELRAVRAYYNWLICDNFGDAPLLKERTSELPEKTPRAEIYQYIVDELNAVIPQLDEEQGGNMYGRMNKWAGLTLLANVYLNAEVYTGTARWQEAMDYANRVLNNGYYRLCTTGTTNPVTGEAYSAYQMLFLADNNETDARYEMIFPVMFDGVNTRSYGGMNYLILAAYSAGMSETVPSGTNNSWGKCSRVRQQLLDKFYRNTAAPAADNVEEMTSAANDDRALFYGAGFTTSIEDEADQNAGYGCVKFRNVRSDGQTHPVIDYVYTDLPLFRMAEAYLTYAEASTRLNGANADASEKINVLRRRANASTQNIYTLNEILDEWSREFWFEGRRRMDLIRFGSFAGQANYRWEWMGGTYNGAQFGNHMNIFAIPENDLTNNSNLTQNPGY